ncbi:HAD family phosphatase [Gilvimarinus agarilyticus]|uniref:HAD family hydrolase n=1 Tax=unclassified Gilvimarinus TaxID=2642066 RepID=UPI001C089B4C|nr:MULTISPECIES: HAD family phosphatase [unclassified Gilvimarinus]MBU2886118.1 HAD family phosphatase [Gilvimarinus agarilyticus]MDO6570828.1 HAD family phosphatase [Gilvimarinus sp. 2_MG-2023]MDO6746996.1 HAD family phosphatase [Gilvimarinus sp. 1_MG-2023]
MVIFDCDGVLVDTETLHAKVLSACLASIDVCLSYDEVLVMFRGKSIATCQELVASLLIAHEPYKRWPQPKLDSFASDFWGRVHRETLQAFNDGVQPVAGVCELLQQLQLKKVPYCVASNGRHEKMQLSLTQAGLISFFPRSVRFSATEVERGKPEPDLFLLAARTLGYSINHCLVVEDSPSGAEAARRAGMPVLGYCPAGTTEDLAKQMRQQGAVIIRHMSEVLSKV